MSKVLSGLELQGYIKERQLKQVRNLRQEHKILPKLAIIMGPNSSQATKTYVRLKRNYAEDLGILVEEYVEANEDAIRDRIVRLNTDDSVQGVILQLPITGVHDVDTLCNLLSPAKDVDGLAENSDYYSATAEAIDWLVTGYNIELEGSRIVIVGAGKLVGGPLAKLWQSRELDVKVLDVDSTDFEDSVRSADVLVSATGVPRIVPANFIKFAGTVIDAGTASEGGVLVGDVEESARDRADLAITPLKGGVGPLTIAALFDHLIQSCLRLAGKL